MAFNTTNIVLPGPYNPKTDVWCDYKEQLLCALDAAGLSRDSRQDEDKSRSLFLSQCAKDTYALIASLLVPLRPCEVEFGAILRLLDKFYEPEINEILQAGKFHIRAQLHKESVQDFVAAISALAAKCNFTDLERQLRDRIVLGVRDERLRRELLKTKGLTCRAAIQMCLNHQATFEDMYPGRSSEVAQHSSSQSAAESMDIGKIKSNECKHCTRIHKAGEKCIFVKAKCFKCHKYGHIARACDRKTKVHQVEDNEQSDDKQKSSGTEDMMGVYVCADTYQPPIKANVVIDGANLMMEIDSGASRSIMSEKTFKKLWTSPPTLHSTNVKLVTWTRDSLKVVGVANVRVVLGEKEAQCELIVVSGDGPSLLGRNWFQLLGLQVTGLYWAEEDLVPFKKDFPELFKDDLGTYRGPEVSLHLRPDAVPRFLKARAVPFPMKQQVEEELNRMVETGVLTPVRYSEWATPLRIVKKEDGSLRICGDYRSTVNASIQVDRYPLPTSVEAFEKLSGGRVFSKLDLKHAYTQMKVDDETAKLLTLNTPIGLMKVNRLAFGVSAAPCIFQRVMSSMLAGMEGVACLLDDVAVAGATLEQHNHRLHKVMEKLNEVGFRLNSKKCVFAANSITFLGHIIDSEGLHPAPAKIKEIKEKPAPTNKETLRAFLGLYNFYQKFLPNRATLLEPLYRLLESKTAWSWGESEQRAFDKAKLLLSSDLTLVGYDLRKELLLICDSSAYGVGAIIAHVMDDGAERPIMMASRTLQAHERKYGQIDKEALAIMFGLLKFHEFLLGRKFCIITDHKPLVGLFNPGKPIPDQISPRMLRWSIKLACYEYTIKHRPGKSIGNADALSRWTEPTTGTMAEEDLKEVLLLEEQPRGWDLSAKSIAMETRKDTLLQKVWFHLLHGWPNKNTDPELQPFWTRREALSHTKDCLLWSNRVIVPAKLHEQVLKILHAPHAGIVQTKSYARGYVWWPQMDNQIEQMVASCEQCQLVRNSPPRDPQTWIMSEKPWQRVHIDFAGPFLGKTFFVMIDSHSKWIEAEIVNSMSSGAVITVMRRIFASQGLPDVVVSDNGKAFTSDEFDKFLQKNGIRHLLSPPYHPATNGQIERAIQTFKNKIKRMQHLNMPWSEMLSKVLFHMRTVPNSVTNKTPAEMLNGRKYRTAISSLHPDSGQSRGEEQLEAAAQRAPARAFVVDQPVLIHMYGAGQKWQRATVEMVEGPSSYRVRTEDGELHRRHSDQILARTVTAEARLVENENRDTTASDSQATVEPDIEVPPSERWPDIIGIPSSSD